MAVFLITPIDNPSYNQIASFFIDQEFNVSNKLAIKAGGKTYTRINNIIDEAANLPTIANLEKKITLSLGMNIVWTLVVQSLEQLEINYSPNQAKTIQDNCGNKVYLLTDSHKTAKEFSDRLGQRTVKVNAMQTNTLQMSSAANTSLIAQNLLDPMDLLNLQNGECVILRSSKRFDNQNRKIIPYPIFNEGKDSMPMRWQMAAMSKEFAPEMPIADINGLMHFEEMSMEQITINDWNAVFKEVSGGAFAVQEQKKTTPETKQEQVIELNKEEVKQVKREIKQILETKYFKILDEQKIQLVEKEIDTLNLNQPIKDIQGTELSQHKEIIDLIIEKTKQQQRKNQNMRKGGNSNV